MAPKASKTSVKRPATAGPAEQAPRKSAKTGTSKPPSASSNDKEFLDFDLSFHESAESTLARFGDARNIMAHLQWQGDPSDMVGLLPIDVCKMILGSLSKQFAEDAPKLNKLRPILDTLRSKVDKVVTGREVSLVPQNSIVDQRALAKDIRKATKTGSPVRNKHGTRLAYGEDAQGNPDVAIPAGGKGQVRRFSTPSAKSSAQQTRLGVNQTPSPEKFRSSASPGAVDVRYYKISNDELGKGGFGTVYKGEDPSGKACAIKVHQFRHLNVEIDPKLPTLDLKYVRIIHEARSRELRREIKWLSKFNHENIIEYLGHGYYKGNLLFIMPLMQGDMETYFGKRVANFQKLRQIKTKEEAGRMWSRAYWRAWTQMLSALSYLHKTNVVHLDIKPENVLYTGDPSDIESIVWKLTDFGISKHQGKAMWEVQTPGWIPPENIDPPQGVEGRVHKSADVWPVYRILWKAFTSHIFEDEAQKPKDPYPMTPWASMFDEDPLKRMTIDEALELTKLDVNVWTEIDEESGQEVYWYPPNAYQPNSRTRANKAKAKAAPPPVKSKKQLQQEAEAKKRRSAGEQTQTVAQDVALEDEQEPVGGEANVEEELNVEDEQSVEEVPTEEEQPAKTQMSGKGKGKQSGQPKRQPSKPKPGPKPERAVKPRNTAKKAKTQTVEDAEVNPDTQPTEPRRGTRARRAPERL